MAFASSKSFSNLIVRYRSSSNPVTIQGGSQQGFVTAFIFSRSNEKSTKLFQNPAMNATGLAPERYLYQTNN